MEHTPGENMMGAMPINKLLLKVSTPLMIAMVVQGMYNVVDSIFVSMVSENALTAVTLAYPVQLLMIAVSVGLSVGIGACLAKSLGEKNQEKASKFAVNGLFLSTIGGLLFMVFGLFFARHFMEHQTDIQEIVDAGSSYLSICTTCALAVFYQIAFERFLQSTGRTGLTLISQGLGAICNIVLDPILIFGLFGLPAMGVTGAAIATVSGQTLGFLLGYVLNHWKNHELDLRLKGFHPEWGIIKPTMAIAIPTIVMQSVGSVMSYCMNLILMTFTTTATAVFGIFFKLQSMVLMPIYGLMNGMAPIISYNYGAVNPQRMRKTFCLSAMYAVIIGVIGFLVMFFLPKGLLTLFDAEEYMFSIGVPALKIMSLSFITAGFNICSSSAFQSVGKGMYSLLTTTVRQLLVLVPLAFLFSLTGNLELIWWAFPIAEIFCVTACILMLKRVDKRILLPMAEKNR